MSLLIDVDNEVWGPHFRRRREPFVDSPNSVLRRALGLGAANLEGTRRGRPAANASAGEGHRRAYSPPASTVWDHRGPRVSMNSLSYGPWQNGVVVRLLGR